MGLFDYFFTPTGYHYRETRVEENSEWTEGIRTRWENSLENPQKKKQLADLANNETFMSFLDASIDYLQKKENHDRCHDFGLAVAGKEALTMLPQDFGSGNGSFNGFKLDENIPDIQEAIEELGDLLSELSNISSYSLGSNQAKEFEKIVFIRNRLQQEKIKKSNPDELFNTNQNYLNLFSNKEEDPKEDLKKQISSIMNKYIVKDSSNPSCQLNNAKTAVGIYSNDAEQAVDDILKLFKAYHIKYSHDYIEKLINKNDKEHEANHQEALTYLLNISGIQEFKKIEFAPPPAEKIMHFLKQELRIDIPPSRYDRYYYSSTFSGRLDPFHKKDADEVLKQLIKLLESINLTPHKSKKFGDLHYSPDKINFLLHHSNIPMFEYIDIYSREKYRHSFGDQAIEKILHQHQSAIDGLRAILQVSRESIDSHNAAACMLMNNYKEVDYNPGRILNNTNDIEGFIYEHQLKPTIQYFTDIKDLKSLLESGGSGIVRVYSGFDDDNGHSVVIDSVNSDGTVTIRDPAHGHVVKITTKAFMNSLRRKEASRSDEELAELFYIERGNRRVHTELLCLEPGIHKYSLLQIKNPQKQIAQSENNSADKQFPDASQ